MSRLTGRIERHMPPGACSSRRSIRPRTRIRRRHPQRTRRPLPCRSHPRIPRREYSRDSCARWCRRRAGHSDNWLHQGNSRMRPSRYRIAVCQRVPRSRRRCHTHPRSARPHRTGICRGTIRCRHAGADLARLRKSAGSKYQRGCRETELEQQPLRHGPASQVVNAPRCTHSPHDDTSVPGGCEHGNRLTTSARHEHRAALSDHDSALSCSRHAGIPRR